MFHGQLTVGEERTEANLQSQVERDLLAALHKQAAESRAGEGFKMPGIMEFDGEGRVPIMMNLPGNKRKWVVMKLAVEIEP